MRALLLGCLVLTALTACSSDEEKTYATYQECFDDLTQHAKKTTVDSIVECCIDHTVAGAKGARCGDTDADCINYLTANLKQTDADITVQTQACSAYIAAKAQQ